MILALKDWKRSIFKKFKYQVDVCDFYILQFMSVHNPVFVYDNKALFSSVIIGIES